MGFDANIKRYFPALVCALIALAAYLQASGIGELVASKVVLAPAPSVPAKAPTAVLPSSDRASGEPILRRNPFDSVTGPLDGTNVPAVPSDDDAADETPPAGLSLDDPKCDFGRVVLITASDDPAWSFAAIEARGASKLRRVGDDVDGHRLEALAWDRVWLAKGASRCQMKVGDGASQAARAAGPTAAPGDEARSTRPASRSDRVPPELAAKIQRISDTEFAVERAVVDEILDNQAQLMRRTRINPVKSGDKTTGIQVSRIKEGSLLDTLGIKDGDELRNINGFELGDPQKALEAYGRLRAADRLTVQIVRNGQTMSIEYGIK